MFGNFCCPMGTGRLRLVPIDGLRVVLWRETHSKAEHFYLADFAVLN